MLDLTRRAVLASAGALVVGSPAFAQQRSPLVINTYGARWERFWRDQIIPALERDANLNITLDVGLGRTWMANLRAAGVAAPPYSILMINEVFADVLRTEGYFEPIPVAQVPNIEKLHPVARNPQDNGIYGMISPIGIAYRTDLIRRAPTSWKDLWDVPEYRGKTGLYQIGNSAGQMFLMLTSRLYGSGPMDLDVGFRKIAELLPFPQVDFSGSLATLMTRGEVAIGVLDVPEVVALKRRGIPIEFARPSEGLFMFEQSFNVLRNAPNKAGAYRYLNMLLSTEMQTRLVGEFFTTPVNREVEIPANLRAELPIGVNQLDQILRWPWSQFNAQRDAIIDRWNRTIR